MNQMDESAALTIPAVSGLSASEAILRLQHDGPNSLPQEKSRDLARIVLDVIREPMLQLLLAAGVIYLVLGDLAEALILLAFAVLNVVLVVVQESRTEKALAALKDLSAPRALVLRDGRRQRVSAHDLVIGDIVIVSEGDRVPADAALIEAVNLEVDESLLTGESIPVRKIAGMGTAEDARPGGNDSRNIWSGSLVVRGEGTAHVVATGPRTEMGRIGRSLATLETAASPLHEQTGRLVRLFAAAGLGSAILLTVVYGILHGTWVKAVLAGITLAMATLPEEFPLVLTIFLIMGAWRIAKSHVLARRSAAVEALGAATVLCADKTGTLTQNRMSVAKLVSGNEHFSVTGTSVAELPERFHRLVEFAILASRPDPFDPMERAFHDLGQHYLAHTEHLHSDFALVRDYAFSHDLLAMSQVWKAAGGGDYIIAAKGAPEAVADLCHVSGDTLDKIRQDIAALAAGGLRVLAIAEAQFSGSAWPAEQHGFDFTFVGLVGLADPLRPGVPDAVAACAAAGIRVVMITGDHPTTACAIAHQAGIATGNVITGQELAELADEPLRRSLENTSVFARIMPEQKLRLVQAFVANGDVVVMTGDGVNDAPSLKAAHIGVAMGGRGTDVAREAAALVLLDDDFTNLVTAIRLGRRIDDNLRKAFGYILAVHVPIAGMSLLPVLFGLPLLLGPIHVVFLELIIDPVSSIVFEAEPEEKDVMARPPRNPKEPLFDRSLLFRGLLQGGVVLAAALAVFLIGIRDLHGDQVARAMAFVTLVLGNLGLVMTNRSASRSVFLTAFRPNKPLAFVVCITLLALVLSLSIPQLREIFAFAPLSITHLAEATGAAVASVIVIDVFQLVMSWIRARAWMLTRKPASL
ncbi:cation-translocating P-type ATPase [Methyloferula stellata]|uniref:cation-translocating P-type ATPase n=1 Tax=Methyloferula stellata TaxID=876270 RepID=UPI00035D1DD0|nr:cation-translocating P-type ATPase [Methyloferula stellata]